MTPLLTAAAATPDEGMGKLVGLCIAIVIAYVVLTTRERYASQHDSDDDTPLPRGGRAPKPLPSGVSERHATVDTAREQARRKTPDSRDRRPGRGDSGRRKGRQPDDSIDDSGLSRWQKAKNIWRHGATEAPAGDPELELELEDQEEPDVDPAEPVQFHAYRPTPAAGPEPELVIDLDLEDAPPPDPTIPGEDEQLRDYVDRMDLDKVTYKRIVLLVQEHYGKSEATTARALREARARRKAAA